jgi:rare lipoprotein A
MYTINGRTYHVLNSAKGYDKKGIASWYGSKFHGHLTSTREPYDMFALTAASTELPLPTYVRVTNLENGRQAIVKVNDRGPFDKNRILDLSYAAARKLGFVDKGTALVEVTDIDLIKKSINKPHIYLQIGSFAKQHNAEHLQDQIAPLITTPIQINNSIYNNKPIYQVQIGPLASVKENDHLQQLLATKGLQPITVIK